MAALTTILVDPPTLKRCSRCGQQLPIGQFRRRSKGSDKPHADCRECHRIEQRRWRAEKAGKVFRRLASDVHRYRGSSIDRIATLVAVALNSFGGLARFVRLWREHFDRVAAQGKSDIVIRQMTLMFDLLLVSTVPRQRIDQETLDQVTDEELVQEQQRQFMRLLVEFGETDEEARRMVERIYARLRQPPPRRAG